MDAKKIEGIKHFCSVARVTYTIIWQSNQIIFKSVSVAKFFNLDFSKTGFFSMQLFLTQKITLCISIYVQIQYTFCIITSCISISQILKAKSNVININAPFAASSIAVYFHSSQECG